MLTAAVAVAGACTAEATPPLTPPADSSTTTVTTAAPTTTAPPSTTVVDNGTSPITGLPIADTALAQRRVLAVKIDNHAEARPQSGLDPAEAVYELMVEGITRFIVLFHQADTDYLGPIRSGRPTDGELLEPLDATFAISGGQEWVEAGIVAHGVHLIADTRPAMFRISSSSAPHNLYGDTVLLRAEADRRGYPDEAPPPLWGFGPLPGGAAASVVGVDFGQGDLVTWQLAEGRYQRWFAGQPFLVSDQEGETSQVVVDTLVVLFAERYTASPSSGSGSPVPAMHTVGEGRAIVFSGGKAVEGEWVRASSADPFQLSTAEGDPLPVPPGVAWISIVPDNRSVQYGE